MVDFALFPPSKTLIFFYKYSLSRTERERGDFFLKSFVLLGIEEIVKDFFLGDN